MSKIMVIGLKLIELVFGLSNRREGYEALCLSRFLFIEGKIVNFSSMKRRRGSDDRRETLNIIGVLS
jgi:hypothetical protein